MKWRQENVQGKKRLQKRVFYLFFFFSVLSTAHSSNIPLWGPGWARRPDCACFVNFSDVNSLSVLVFLSFVSLVLSSSCPFFMQITQFYSRSSFFTVFISHLSITAKTTVWNEVIHLRNVKYKQNKGLKIFPDSYSFINWNYIWNSKAYIQRLWLPFCTNKKI